MKKIEVGCAIITRKNEILIAQRKPGDSLSGYWEFPGGKRWYGETLEECLVREVYEELRVYVSPRKLIYAKEHTYPGKQLHLFFYHCEWVWGCPVKMDCHDFKWVMLKDLKRYLFLPADIGMINDLVERGRFLLGRN